MKCAQVMSVCVLAFATLLADVGPKAAAQGPYFIVSKSSGQVLDVPAVSSRTRWADATQVFFHPDFGPAVLSEQASKSPA